MNNEMMLTNFAIWLQAVHGKDTGLKYNSDKRLNELANEWLAWSSEKKGLSIAEKKRAFQGYDEKTETCYYCFEVVTAVNCNTWHCHECGYYSLVTEELCMNCRCQRNLTTSL